jgi:hypothetical protein
VELVGTLLIKLVLQSCFMYNGDTLLKNRVSFYHVSGDIMRLQELVQQRANLNCAILQELQDDIRNIKLLGENMVECATNIKGQGYSSFMAARETFISKIDDLHSQLEDCLIINSCTH